ncbi:hypothetical protein LSH36_1377g00032 [Paralvinella palmiformis]|uniref:F5/8 type C domain-containing protein n=1 Tax=Paralvinella palmiformis TaxID=53620 RepID=A0AAD9IU85_9ANNE|nr:hypothetical protein LSH36_1377g00032 [Paralvinella palmiformis]
MLKKILIFNLFVCLVSGECFFEKHFGYLLSGVGPKANVVLSVRGPLKCETLCLSDYSDQCEAANIIFIKADIYSCEIFRELQPTFNSSQLMSRLKGKFIRRKEEIQFHDLIFSKLDNGWRWIKMIRFATFNFDDPGNARADIDNLAPHRLIVVTCTSGTRESESFVCENVFDGVRDPGFNNEWASLRNDTNSWIRLEFRSAEVVAMIRIWWRCPGRSQYSELHLDFSNGSRQTVKYKT